MLGLECFPAPGHASHHVCYVDEDGTLYAGDAAGVRIKPSGHVLPVSPPPDIDVEAWKRTLDEIERRGPQRLALIHFGALRRRRVPPGAAAPSSSTRGPSASAPGATEDEFVEAARRDLYGHVRLGRAVLRARGPFWQSYAGLRRWWEKQG